MRGNVGKIGDNLWQISVELPPDPDGKRRRRWKRVKGTKRQAEQALTALLRERDTGTLALDPARQTVAQFLDHWLKAAAPNLAPRTYERHAELVRTHIAPELGSLRLTDLRPNHIAAAQGRWLESGRVRHAGGGGLSPSTVRLIYAVLHRALAEAVRWQLLAVNPASAVTPPRAPRREMAALDPTQAAVLLAAARGSEFEVPLLTALYSGLRLSELRGLRWHDVDLDAGRLSVTQTLQRRYDGTLVVTPPKSHRSRRAVSIPASVSEALRAHRRARAEARLLAGAAWEASDLIFTDALGRPLDEGRLRHAFERLLQGAGLPRIRWHDLRHTMASLMLASGEHPKVVSERLGHSTVMLTLDTYSHVLPGLQAAAAERLDDLLRGAGEREGAGS